MLISTGNLKLGILPSFSLPPIATCPGRTPFCTEFCFGTKGRYTFPGVIAAHERNLESSRRGDFADNMVKEISRGKASAFRFHGVGDFYSIEYIMKWMDIAAQLPEIMFFGSTRSWRVANLVLAVMYLRDLPNFTLRASVDPSNEIMPGPGWSLWSIEGEGEPCLHDTSIGKTCFTCKRCWKSKLVNTSFKLRWGDYTV